MSGRTFRAVVAFVLVAALALAVVMALGLVQRPTQPAPSASPTTSPETTAAPTIAPTPSAGPAFAIPDVVSVGRVARGTTSGMTLVVTFHEAGIDAIPDAPGSFRLTLADRAGDGSTVAFIGSPIVDAPGSLGATVTLAAPNVLMISIQASDTINFEPITIRGLGITASSTAAVGPLSADLDGFTGSLAGGAASSILASPGMVTAGP